MTTCCPSLPDFYEEVIIKDIQMVFEHALGMLSKCEPNSSEFDFYYKIIGSYDRYHADTDNLNEDA